MKKRVWKRTLAAALSVALVGSLAAGCKKKNAAGGSSGKVDTVTIGTQEMPNDEEIAKAKNYFEKKMGVKVKIVNFDSGKDVNNALAAKSIDFGLEGTTPSALAIATDIPVQVIWVHEILGDIEALAVRKKDNIRSIKDLKGKKIAVPFATTSHYCLLRYLKSQNISENDVTLLDMDPSGAYAAWKRGDVDAAWIWRPTLQKVLDDGGKILVSNKDAADEGYMTANLEVVRTDFAEAHPDIVTKYIQALMEAQNLYKNNKDDALTSLSAQMGLDKSEVQEQIKGSLWLTAKEQLESKYLGTGSKKGELADTLYDTANFLKDQKNINNVPDKSVFEERVNPEFIEDALK